MAPTTETKDCKLSLFDAVVEIADPEKLSRFDALAQEFGHSRHLIALLSEPAGSSRHLWSRQFELRDRGRDAYRLCNETQDLHASLIADLLAACMASRLTARGFIGAAIQTLDPQLFGIPGLKLRLDRNTIELPDGQAVLGIQMRITRQPEVADPQDASDGLNMLTFPSEANPDARASVSEEEVKTDHQQARRRGGRIPQPIWDGAEIEAMRVLEDDGHPLPGDGGQTRLERHISAYLAERGHHPAESTVRRYVARWIALYRATLA